MAKIPSDIWCCPRRNDSSERFQSRAIDLYTEIRRSCLVKRRHIFIGFIGDWGVGKDTLALRMLEMDVPEPKLEQDHPISRRRCGDEIPHLKAEFRHFDILMRIIPGNYAERDREEDLYCHINQSYNSDALVFCFALNSRVSFNHLETKWIPEVMIASDESIPFFVVMGTKTDLPQVVTKEEAKHFAYSKGAKLYSMCSALNNVCIIYMRDYILGQILISRN